MYFRGLYAVKYCILCSNKYLFLQMVLSYKTAAREFLVLAQFQVTQDLACLRHNKKQ